MRGFNPLLRTTGCGIIHITFDILRGIDRLLLGDKFVNECVLSLTPESLTLAYTASTQ